MGPSGSGKTSLLTLLGGRSGMEFEGRVSVNGRRYDKAVRKQVGFVLQDDTLYEDLTVKVGRGAAELGRCMCCWWAPRHMQAHPKSHERAINVWPVGIVERPNIIILPLYFKPVCLLLPLPPPFSLSLFR